MLKVNMKAIVFNRGKMEFGIIKKKWMRKGVTYFNVQLDRDYLMENLTINIEKPCHLLQDLSIKINKSK